MRTTLFWISLIITSLFSFVAIFLLGLSFMGIDLIGPTELEMITALKKQKAAPITITFNVPKRSLVSLDIVNPSGTLVRTLIKDRMMEPGPYEETWEATDAKGKEVPPGKYSYEVTTRTPGVPVLLYHHVAPVDSGFDSNPYAITPEEFKTQMAYLKKEGFTALSVTELAKYLNTGQNLPPKPVLITFDDGYESIYRYVFPVLKDDKLQATVFTVVYNVEHPDPNAIRPLTWSQMQEMERSGVIDIESHSYNMHRQVVIDENGAKGSPMSYRIYLQDQKRRETDTEFRERLEQDFRVSKQKIEAKLNKKVLALSWPGGNHQVKVAQAAGFTYFFDGDIGPVYLGISPLAIGRIMIPKNIGLENFIKAVNPEPKASSSFGALEVE